MKDLVTIFAGNEVISDLIAFEAIQRKVAKAKGPKAPRIKARKDGEKFFESHKIWLEVAWNR